MYVPRSAGWKMGACLSFPLLRMNVSYARVCENNDDDDDTEDEVLIFNKTVQTPPSGQQEGLRNRLRQGVFH
jgi:hypothetical protein